MSKGIKELTRKDVILGLGLGLGVGLPLAALILILLGPWNNAAPAATPSPTLMPTSTIMSASPTATPTPMVAQPTATPAPTSTPLAASETITHVVAPNEVLGGIALEYGVTVEAILEANDLDDPDSIWAGAVLIIPGADYEPTPEETPFAVDETPDATETPWSFSTIEGDLTSAYPATVDTSRFTIHYTPGTYPEADIENVEAMLERGLAHIERSLQTNLSGTFDVYVAGSVFAPPNQALRGRSFSAARYYFFLHDGTGNPSDQQYIATHEMTHLFTWNTFGRPVSAMLSEGIAVYTGMTLIADSNHMPIETFCKAYRQAGQLPRVSGSPRFYGHIRDLENYYTAGCFVQYLVETYGPAAFGELYPTGDYTTVYGKSLSVLEQEWLAALDSNVEEVTFNPQELIDAVNAVSRAYSELFDGFSGTPEEQAAYEKVDQARIALLEGRFTDVDTHLAQIP
ncbi:MAG: LysM peptidoglycan-binding domain-containing protein [Anaerolineae bacterium]